MNSAIASNCPFSPAFARGCNRCLRLCTCWHLTLLSENASVIIPTCPSGNCTTEAASVTSCHGHGGTANSRALIFLLGHKLANQTVFVLFCQPKGLSTSSSVANFICTNFILANVPPLCHQHDWLHRSWRAWTTFSISVICRPCVSVPMCGKLCTRAQ